MKRIAHLGPLCVIGLVIALGAVPPAIAQRQMPPGAGGPQAPGETPSSAKALLGEALFFDTSLSSPDGQSCASCHDPGNGWVDPRGALDPLYHPTSQGVVADRFGPRNSLSLAYADFTPSLFYDAATGSYIGGRYRDGRAPTALAQPGLALMNRAEMNNPNVRSVVLAVRKSASAQQFEQVYGRDIWKDHERAFDAIAECLVAFQTLITLNRFDSRFDRFMEGDAEALTPYERAGLALFEGKGGCAACHSSAPRPDGTPPLFTTYRYHNLGVPGNPRNPFYGMPASINPDGTEYVDRGLGGALGLESEAGKFKIPTLRNVALTGPYMHNGVFTTLAEAVQFLNSRDVDRRWGPPEVAENICSGSMPAGEPIGTEGARRQPPGSVAQGGVPGGLGNLGLTPLEVDQIVAFLRTLNDEPSPGT